MEKIICLFGLLLFIASTKVMATSIYIKNIGETTIELKGSSYPSIELIGNTYDKTNTTCNSFYEYNKKDITLLPGEKKEFLNLGNNVITTLVHAGLNSSSNKRENSGYKHLSYFDQYRSQYNDQEELVLEIQLKKDNSAKINWEQTNDKWRNFS